MQKIIIGLFLIFGLQTHAQASNYADLLSRIVTPEGVKLQEWGKKEKNLMKKVRSDFKSQKLTDLKDKDETLAFWLNAHNFCVIVLLQESWPVSDVMGISGFRDQLQCPIAGKERSLYEMDSGLIRPRYKDPRTRFALWWGTKGGPPLRNKPYTGKNLDEELDTQVKESLKGDRLAWTSEDDDSLKLSALFEWYRGDFGEKDAAVINFLRSHLPEEKAELLPKTYGEASFGGFDWTIDLPGATNQD